MGSIVARSSWRQKSPTSLIGKKAVTTGGGAVGSPVVAIVVDYGVKASSPEKTDKAGSKTGTIGKG